ncbi:TIR domain-containing protein [Thiothrix caldifontis]|uniref:TIR domain-containing protein n=1 Tax=Thiothrix caldifontis TaxID=525918 RepID=A0A1H3VLG9_9GAMM|nr:toll/interleukin-1 receptor domain-containing protein [Thiothrix caldifontis]SDZ75620.1 TIR domain-containing protein [Thiothrix caldifontis]
MTYEYDVFLSYRRYGMWPRWVSGIFLEIFKHWLGEELGRDVTIFFDQDMETGTNWPSRLANAHAKSRVLVPLWSHQYFTSDWCLTELSLMRAREEQCGFSSRENPKGLIIPAIIHDCEDLPSDIKCIQSISLHGYTNPLITINSPTAEKLSDAISDRWAKDIAHAINSAPEYDASWLNLSHEKFKATYSRNNAKQTQVPRI